MLRRNRINRDEYVSSLFRKKSVTPENAKTQSWVTKTVWQRIPGRRARNSETPTTITVQSIQRNDQLPMTTFNHTCWSQYVIKPRLPGSESNATTIHRPISLYYLTDELCQVTDVEARQRLRSSSSSSLIVSRTRLLTVMTELSRSPLHVSGTVCQILSLPHLS